MELLQTIGILDIVFVVILAISVIVGMMRGAIREVMSLLGLAAAIYFAFKFSDGLSKNYIAKIFEDPRVSYIVAFVLIIVLTLFAIAIINVLTNKLLNASGLSFVNRLLGLVFGLLRGTIINAVIVLIIGFIPGATNENWWKQSTLAPFFKQVAQQASGQLPKDLSGYLDSSKKTLNSAGETILHIENSNGQTSEPSKTKTEKKDPNDIDVNKILESIQESNREAGATPNIQLESTNTVDDNKETGLVLESVQ